jgi:GxxExxY protein
VDLDKKARAVLVDPTSTEPFLEFRDITEKIIGAAFRVYNTLGFGFLESVYEKALLFELHRVGLKAVSQQQIDVWYESHCVGHFEADLLVEGVIIVELKSVRALTPAHEAQLVNYLTATGKPVGLLINFGERTVEVRRKARRLREKAELASPNPVNPVNPVQEESRHELS